MNDEYLPLVDAEGTPIGKVLRSRCHGNPELIHPVVHLHVYDTAHRLFLQKRAPDKDLFPDYWDTSVGGHVSLGEEIKTALLREAKEELDIDAGAARFLYSYLMRNRYETEFVSTFLLAWDAEIHINRQELSEGRFFSAGEIKEKLGTGIFTPNFEQEWAHLCANGIF